MSRPDLGHDLSPQAATTEALQSRAARMIEDPFGSIWLGLVAPAAAVGVVVSGILGLAIVY